MKEAYEMLKSLGNSIAFIMLNVMGIIFFTIFSSHKILKAFLRAQRRVNHDDTGNTFKSFTRKYKLANYEVSCRQKPETISRARQSLLTTFCFELKNICLKNFLRNQTFDAYKQIL